jgi:hypothetical protein
MKPFRLVLFFCILGTSLSSLAADAAPATVVLPPQFGGWQLKGSVQSSLDPAAADQVNAAPLKEYLFREFESGTYVRNDGRRLTVRLARFEDATGAYGAFTFYRQPEMLDEKIGDQGSSLNNRVLFYRGNNLVDALFDKLTVMSAAELRELAALLPLPPGNANSLPALPGYLPRQQATRNSEKYVAGPAGLARVGAPVPASMVDFASGAEVALKRYSTSAGEASLMLIEYPTPQLAAERLRQIDATHQETTQQAGTATLVDAGPFYDKRTGPIIAIVVGALSQSEAKALLASVNYDADVTWNENTSFTKKDNLANLLVNIILLCGILVGLALVAGVAFGGLRIVLRRFAPGNAFGNPDEVEFISLHLGESRSEPQPRR